MKNQKYIFWLRAGGIRIYSDWDRHKRKEAKGIISAYQKGTVDKQH